MKKLVLALCLPYFLFAYEDLGIKGNLYNITERDFLVMIKEGVEEIDVHAIRDNLKSQVIKQATGQNNLSVCREDNFKKEDDYVILEEDIFTPTGKLFKKKGTKVIAPLQMPLDLCFVSGSNMVTLRNQIDFFDKQTNKRCVFLISDRNVLDVHKIYPNRSSSFFPSKEKDEKRFNVSCLPSRVNLINNDRNIIEHSYEKFKN